MIIRDDCLNWLPTLEPSEFRTVATDPDWSDDTFDWVALFRQCKRITCGGSTVTVWGASPSKIKDLIRYAEAAEYGIKHLFAWYKPNGGQPTGWGISRRWEVVVWLSDIPGRRSDLKYLPDVWAIPRITRASKEDLGHKWQKPLDLCEMMVRAFSREGDIITDPFCGYGSILIEAKRSYRKIEGCDISEKCVIMTEKALGIRQSKGVLF